MTDHSILDASALHGWRKSTYSGPNSDSCVEVLDDHPAGIPVRDSKTPQGPALLFAAGPWSSFITSLRDGDLP
ncbi:DUF397 domain-containing protein [Streptomyces sp. NPDC101145]|uniref:DUF397 domain-containing protein n=1 Tax=Streptomyces sp. NPDC101145 TaxID=3366112 RepID=UPI0038173EEC